MDNVKICTSCFKNKTVENFNKKSSSKDGTSNSCKECCSLKYKEYYQANKDSIKEKVKSWNKDNPDKRRVTNLKYSKNNKEAIQKYRLQYERARYKNDNLFRFKKSLSSLVNKTIRDRGFTKNRKTLSILGCDIDFLLEYLSSQFLDGMTWDNYGSWEIDHIYPISKAKIEEDILILNHYTNLRPLWRVDNRNKLNKIEEIQLKLI